MRVPCRPTCPNTSIAAAVTGAFYLTADAGVIDTLKAARGLCGEHDEARADALDADIAVAQRELEQARTRLQGRLSQKAAKKAADKAEAMNRAAAKAGAKNRKKPRLAQL